MAKNRRSSKRDYSAPHRELDVDAVLLGGRQVTSTADGQWVVQQIRGSKDYICPGCHRGIPADTSHIVAWPFDEAVESSVGERRHWHNNCWQMRARRGW